MKCCICGKEFEGYGNNPYPVKYGGRCCDECNTKIVIPARMSGLFNTGTFDCENCPNNNNAEWSYDNCPVRDAGICTLKEDEDED